jgi:hypothetical protein
MGTCPGSTNKCDQFDVSSAILSAIPFNFRDPDA